MGFGSARHAPAVLALLFGAVSAFGMGFSGEASAANFLQNLFGGEKQSNIDPNYFIEEGFCPTLTVRPGTEVITFRDNKKDTTPDTVRYQASVSDTARECHHDGGMLNLKIGIKGRVVGGPKGTQGKVVLPIRIVAMRAPDIVTYSNLQKVEVAIGPDLAADYQKVFEIQLPAPEGNDLRLHIGFDESGKSDPVSKTVSKPAATKTGSR